MIRGSQSQKGGEGSQQIQVAGNLVLGVDETRAKEIAISTARQVISEYTDEAIALVQGRIDDLDSRVIETLERKNQLDAFADPGFQRTYKKAQHSAAASERATDYDLLAAMLSDRAANPTNRQAIAGVERAIEIVDLVDEQALRAVTIIEALRKWSPNSHEAETGLNVLETLFLNLLDGPLPTGMDWADHLDILDVLRLNTMTELRNFEDYFPSRVIGYVAAGRAEAEVPEFLGGDYEDWPWAEMLMDHDLRPGYQRIATVNEGTLRRDLAAASFTPAHIEAIIDGARVQFGFGQADSAAVQRLMEAVRQRPSLAAIAEWWNTVSFAIQLTGVGRTLALANMFRLDQDKTLPRD